MQQSLNLRQLRWTLVGFLLALAIPTGLLVYRAYDQIKWEVFHQYRLSADEITRRIDSELRRLIDIEETRSFDDYSFLTLASDKNATFAQRSPLSAYPVSDEVPGLIGYFQLDSAGTLSSPIVPGTGTDYSLYGVSAAQYRGRIALRSQIEQILAVQAVRRDTEAKAERAVEVDTDGAKASSEFRQANAFDRLSDSLEMQQASRMEKSPSAKLKKSQGDLASAKLTEDRRFREPAPAQSQAIQRAPRKEQVYELPLPPSYAPEMQRDISMEAFKDTLPFKELERQPRLRIFESEISPFSFELLDARHIVLFRNVWRGSERFIQGLIIERAAFIEQLIAAPFRGTKLSELSDLLTAYRGEVLTVAGDESARRYLQRANELQGERLYQSRLSAPFGALELIYMVVKIPIGSSAHYFAWLTLILTAILCGGCYVIYRYGRLQLSLNQQQQDFVSAVSHELKTPLTSIRMYSEMLKAGWADEEKKRGYYEYIHDESERLSRLINNVLQLARITRGTHEMDMELTTIEQVLDICRSKISSQVKSAGFELSLSVPPAISHTELKVDLDAITQIIINLVDNAIKFSTADARKQIDLLCAAAGPGRVRLSVRDYGGGVPDDQMERIFDLFYRPQDELTRVTVGTGIGLALVRQLATAMGGEVFVSNRDPGAEFTVEFPTATA